MKRVVAIVLFALLFIGGFRPMFLELLVSRRLLHRPGPQSGLNRRPLREKEDPTPADLKSFLRGVRNETRPGDTIALDFAPPYGGWGYTYWRASYVLSGRTILLPGDTDANVIAHFPPGWIERRR